MDRDADSNDIVATAEMCHYCFDVLLKKLLTRSTSLSISSRTGHHHGNPNRRWMYTSASERSKVILALNAGKSDGEHAHDGIDYPTESNSNSAKVLIPTTFTPPKIECPLFVTWDKKRHSYRKTLIDISSEFATPASSNITSDDENSTQTNTNNNIINNNVGDSDSDYDLRGCIGTLAPKSLHSALSEFALTSALRDRRFDPITLQEIPYLRVGVSLLVKYEECLHCLDWVVGVHGIIIRFECRRSGNGYSATYLPEVAHEQRWNQMETVVSLVRKAGYRGVIHDDLLSQIRCTRYQSSKHRLTYEEYVSANGNGVDPLKCMDIMTVPAADEAKKQRAKASKPCVNL